MRRNTQQSRTQRKSALSAKLPSNALLITDIVWLRLLLTCRSPLSIVRLTLLAFVRIAALATTSTTATTVQTASFLVTVCFDDLAAEWLIVGSRAGRHRTSDNNRRLCRRPSCRLTLLCSFPPSCSFPPLFSPAFDVLFSFSILLRQRKRETQYKN